MPHDTRESLVPTAAGSALALDELRLGASASVMIHETEHDSLLYVFEGSGSTSIDGEASKLGARHAVLVLAGEEARLEAGGAGLSALHARVGPEADRHAPLGPRQLVVSLDDAGAESATGARSFQILFGPHNGSTRATIFAGFIPPGKAPWHYHFYDEIVWVPEGPGRLHIGETVTELGPGSVFRLPPREAHIVENTSADRELTVIGITTPAGIPPSAAYLRPDVAAEYRFAG